MTRAGFCLVALLLVLSGCNSNQPSEQPPTFPGADNMVGLNSLTTLQPGTTELHLEDFFLDVSGIDSLDIERSYTATLSDDKKLASIEAVGTPAPYSHLGVWISGHRWALPLRRARKINHTIEFPANGATYSSVAIAGNFNGWNPKNTPFEHVGDVWQTTLSMNPGNYQYQYVLDEVWQLDPNNPDSIDNNIGGFNSVLKIGEVASAEAPVLLTKSFADSLIELEVTGQITGYLAYWDNHLLDETHLTQTSTGLQIIVPADANEMPASHLRVFGWNEDAASNDVLIPLQNGRVVNDASTLARETKHTKSIYFMMVDRFANGNTANDHPVDDPLLEHMANYHGGDLAGITQKIEADFFTELGFNTLWLSPITQNPDTAFVEWPEPHRKFSGYHGYWPTSLTSIDHRIGTPAELHSLVNTAHGKNMNVILDFVSNHVHQEWPLYQQHPEWGTQLDLPDGTKNIRIWDEHRLTTWFDTFLPSLDHSNPEVRQLLADSAMFWLKEYNLDGFRHDATKHIPQQFWRELTRKVKALQHATGQPIFQIGETFGSRELIGDYVNAGQMDGQFDFNLYFDARSAFINHNSTVEPLAESLRESLEYYGYHHLMGNITGNHDMPRFISFAGKALSFDEDPVEAGWSRDVQIEDPVGYQKLQQLTTFLMTIPGVPVVYYGDEFGMPGAGDPDNRRDMRFEGYSEHELATRKHLQLMTGLRNEHMALLYGDLHNIQVSDDGHCLSFERSYFDEHVLVMLNLSDKAQTCSVNSDLLARGTALGIMSQEGISRPDFIARNLPAFGLEVLIIPSILKN